MSKPTESGFSLDATVPGDDQLISSYDLRALAPDRRRHIENYLGTQSPDHSDTMNRLAKELQDTEIPLALTVIPIPIAAHQEAGNIVRSLGQYAKQKTNEPFTVALYPNSPVEPAPEAIEPSFQALKKSRDLFPDLDFRNTDLDEFLEPTMGRIRKNLWDSALFLGFHEGIYDTPYNEMIGINHDIDTVSMSQNYVRRIQNHYIREIAKRMYDPLMVRQTFAPTQSAIKYAPDPERPNVSKVMFWHALGRRQLGDSARYDEGTIIPFGYYAEHGGFNPDTKLSEAIEVVGYTEMYRIPRTNMETSSRRFADRLHTHDFSDIWTEDSFSATDNCRVDPGKDISEERAFEIISGSLESSLAGFFVTTVGEYWDNEGYMSGRELEHRIIGKKRLALTVLERIDPSGELAAIANSYCDTRLMIRDIKRRAMPALLKEYR